MFRVVSMYLAVKERERFLFLVTTTFSSSSSLCHDCSGGRGAIWSLCLPFPHTTHKSCTMYYRSVVIVFPPSFDALNEFMTLLYNNVLSFPIKKSRIMWCFDIDDFSLSCSHSFLHLSWGRPPLFCVNRRPSSELLYTMTILALN